MTSALHDRTVVAVTGADDILTAVLHAGWPPDAARRLRHLAPRLLVHRAGHWDAATSTRHGVEADPLRP